MTRGIVATPAGSRWGLAGVLVFALCAGCDRLTPDPGPATLELDGDTVQLAAGVRLFEVMVATQADGSELEPVRVEAAPGDVVRFTTGDNRLHALAFDAALLSPEARAFLEQTGQLRAPPLVTKGTQWVVTLEGAPAGEYPLTCTTHGAGGSIAVGARRN